MWETPMTWGLAISESRRDPLFQLFDPEAELPLRRLGTCSPLFRCFIE